MRAMSEQYVRHLDYRGYRLVELRYVTESGKTFAPRWYIATVKDGGVEDRLMYVMDEEHGRLEVDQLLGDAST